MLGRMMTDAPIARTARVDVLLTGSPGPACASTCSLIRDGDATIVVDPGLAPSQAAILATLEPVVGVALAAWLLAEQPAAVQVIGGALILGAAILLQLRPGVSAEHEAVVTATEEGEADVFAR